MIEALATYFHEQGFEVSAFAGVLRIRKYIGGGIIGVNWMILREYVKNNDHRDYLFWIAEGYVRDLNQAIAERLCSA